MAKRILLVAALSVGLALNYFLLARFNTLLWPYLWPNPALAILLGSIVALLWAPELGRGAWPLRIVGPIMLFIGQSYLVHSYSSMLVAPSLPALLHFLGFLGTLLVMTLSFVNQLAPRDNRRPAPLPRELPYVAAVVPTYGEPVEILARTIASLKALDYPRERLHIVISDDGHRDEVRELAAAMGVAYNLGAKRDAKAGNLNSALAYLAHAFPQASLILTQDADEIIHPQFLCLTVGYFSDPGIAFVQTPKEAFTPAGDPFGNRDRIFYDVLQPGRNGGGAAFSCGSGVLWRIDALNAIGGFSTWNIVEDMTTSYFLHCAGYRSEYHNQILTVGLSPDDIPGLLKQRGTWAADTWRWFLFQNPLLARGLGLRQRLQYLELGMFYVSSVLFMPLLMVTPLISLLTGTFVAIEGAALFPWVFASVLYYVVLARGNLSHLLRMWQYWIGHWPTYTRAFLLAVRSRTTKPSYKVTRKTRQDGFYGQLVWQQFAYLLVGTLLIFRAIFGMEGVSLPSRLVNVGAISFYMVMVSGICGAAFHGMSAGCWQRLASELRAQIGQRARALTRSVEPLARAQYHPQLLSERSPAVQPVAREEELIARQVGD
jgi:cellulose synthase (UDP-forming)